MRELFVKITDLCKNAFSDNLRGVYVHGSIALGSYNPKKSDVDFLVVVLSDPETEDKAAFIGGLVGLERSMGIKAEVSAVLERYARDFVYPTPFVLHYSDAYTDSCIRDMDGYVKRMNGVDRDLGAHFAVTRQSGITLYGECARDMFAPVPREFYIDSVMYDIGSSVEEIANNPVYTILNLCRTLMYLEDGVIRSKKKGGEDALSVLPDRFEGIILSALDDYTGKGDFAQGEADELRAFAEYMLAEINMKIS